MKKSEQLRRLIESPQLEFIMEAHNGLSSKIVEEAGFKGIWGGGLSISAALGVRDNNEASWTQVLEVIEFMSDSTDIPILLDGDTGFGDFNNVRRLIRKLEQRHVAGVCIEDKQYPKTNSFFFGEAQPLADMDEFCGKIKAGKDAQTDSDFCLVARVEALITGWGMDEALKRAHAYADAGADAILIHSKIKTADEILEFMRQWQNRKPVIIVPTTYCQTPTEVFEKAGISLAVWANQTLRASISAMKQVTQKIFIEGTVSGAEPNIATVSEIFRLQNMQEFKDAETLYRPSPKSIRAIILAASRGSTLGELTEDKPKCMIEIYGRPLIASQIETLNQNQIKDITAVVGYKKDAINLTNLRMIDNDRFASTGILYSLSCAKDFLAGPAVVSYGDILFAKRVLRDLLDTPGDIVLAVDTAWNQGEKANRLKDVVLCEEPYSSQYGGRTTSAVRAVASRTDREGSHGEWIGLMKLSAAGAAIIRREIESFEQDEPELFEKADLVMLLMRMIEKGVDVKAAYHAGHWLDVDSMEDITYADQSTTQSV